MPLGAVVAVASSFITLGKSPRYGGGDGPLYSTVNGFIDRIVSGDLAVINELNNLRVTGGTRGTVAQWALFWNQMVPIQPLTQAQVDLIKRLDPTKTGIVARKGAPIYAAPGQAPPTLQAVAEGVVKVLAPTTITKDSARPALANPLPAVAGGLPLWMLVLLVGGGAWLVYKIVKKG